MSALPHTLASPTQPDRQYALEDSLTATEGRIFLTGTQALVRLLRSQRDADRAAGLNTAGFVTGYRGSPLGGVDMAMWRAHTLLDANQIRFLPAVNEDLAATMVMGTQQAGEREDRKVDGVFALWYGKGPGLDRAGDALHHGNAAGASAKGGVLLIVGDDHTAASSSIPHASETSLISWRVPIVNPATVQEYELFGRWGWALSRYSGAWVAFKAITETVESGRSFLLAPVPDFSVPETDIHQGATGYSAREFLSPDIELRMARRIEAVKAFSRLHSLDRLEQAAPQATLGIVSTGKAFLDAKEAIEQLAITFPQIATSALRHYKIGLSWPIDEDGLMTFARGLSHILVVEEKAPVIESQIKDLLFNQADRPTVCGQRDLDNHPLLSREGQLSPHSVGQALQRWLSQAAPLMMPPCAPSLHTDSQLLPSTRSAAQAPGTELSRRPYFCSGCPHNSSTKVPEGSQALAGVGCHYMATSMSRSTSGLTQMGGEGVDWIGLSSYTTMPHVFQNMGEGTYFHSGYLAIRQAIAAKVNITYKILFNDAVAMTGGQPVDGTITVPGICQQLQGEGVRRIVVTTDDPARYKDVSLPTGITVHHRNALDALQRDLRDIPGVTVLIHDQACAAEKRRRRKKKTLAEPARRLFINTAVCEGCGDCGTQSNCLSLVPVQTPFGRKRAIDQSSCNKDYACADGFCPSFVSVTGGVPRKSNSKRSVDAERLQACIEALPQPMLQNYTRRCNILIAGIGGTGVITLGAILSMAAHLEGRAASVLDITGLAQKGGAVISHIRLSMDEHDPGAVRIGPHQADVAILCDVVAACRPEALQALRQHGTQVTLNTYLAPTPEFTQNAQAVQDPAGLIETLRTSTGCDQHAMLDAHRLATDQFGEGILANMMMLGHAWQRGGIPLSADAIMRALELNGVEVQANKKAFSLGRLAAHQPSLLDARASRVEQTIVVHRPESLDAVTARFGQELAAYQDAAYAKRYLDTVERVRLAEQAIQPDSRSRLALAVAHSLYKLMAYKDEYEVARLYTNGAFRQQLNEAFEGDYTLRFHLAPPLIAPRDPSTGRPRKISLGPATESVFKVLARCKRLRGTWLDIFSYSAERRLERELVLDYERALAVMVAQLNAGNYQDAVKLASLPQEVRGFGYIKENKALECQAQLRAYAMRQTGAQRFSNLVHIHS